MKYVALQGKKKFWLQVILLSGLGTVTMFLGWFASSGFMNWLTMMALFFFYCAGYYIKKGPRTYFEIDHDRLRSGTYLISRDDILKIFPLGYDTKLSPPTAVVIQLDRQLTHANGLPLTYFQKWRNCNRIVGDNQMTIDFGTPSEYATHVNVLKDWVPNPEQRQTLSNLSRLSF